MTEQIKDERKRYECNCYCGKTFYACKSIFQEWGILDKGHGSCPECKTFYNLSVDEENGKMILTEWNKYLNKRELLKENIIKNNTIDGREINNE